MIGAVGQEPVLFSTTIYNNIIYGSQNPEQVQPEQVYKAADLSNSLEFINSFPNKFDTNIGEHGSSMLSGGQKQRIAIARALVSSPRLLIFDEATSALDATSEYLVRKALSQLLENNQQTVMIIAHRLSTIKHADQIVVLDKVMFESFSFDNFLFS
jgi:ABC-type multidrug transport system fused ATPase/permease subunit